MGSKSQFDPKKVPILLKSPQFLSLHSGIILCCKEGLEQSLLFWSVFLISVPGWSNLAPHINWPLKKPSGWVSVFCSCKFGIKVQQWSSKSPNFALNIAFTCFLFAFCKLNSIFMKITTKSPGNVQKWSQKKSRFSPKGLNLTSVVFFFRKVPNSKSCIGPFSCLPSALLLPCSSWPCFCYPALLPGDQTMHNYRQPAFWQRGRKIGTIMGFDNYF